MSLMHAHVRFLCVSLKEQQPNACYAEVCFYSNFFFEVDFRTRADGKNNDWCPSERLKVLFLLWPSLMVGRG